MLDQRRTLLSAALAFSLLALAAFLAGCGTDRSPTAASADPTDPAAKRIDKKSRTTSTAAASTAETSSDGTSSDGTSSDGTSGDGTGRHLLTKTASGTFSPDRSGSLTAKFPNSYGDWTDLRLKEARFDLQSGAIDAAQEITMTVTAGYVLADIDVEFSPDGLTFMPPATLTLTIWWGCESCRADEQLAILEALAQHIHPDGTLTEYGFDISRQGNAFLIVTIDVPGFSRYLIRNR